MFKRAPLSSPKPAEPPAQSQPQTPPPPAKPSGWVMQALTNEYTATGVLTPVDMPLIGYLNVPTQATITLLGAQLQPVGALAAPAASLGEIIFPKTTLIAIIPHDEAGRRSAAQQMPNRPLRLIAYVGPYVLRGSLMVPGDMPLRNAFATAAANMLAVTDAEVACLLPGSRMPAFKTPLLILNKQLVQLYHPAD